MHIWIYYCVHVWIFNFQTLKNIHVICHTNQMPTLISQIHPARVYIMAAPGVPAPFDSRADPQCLIKYDALRAHMNTVFANEV